MIANSLFIIWGFLYTHQTSQKTLIYSNLTIYSKTSFLLKETSILLLDPRCERERRVESFSFFWCWTHGYERERVFDYCSCFERVERRNEMDPYLSFDVWTRGFERGRKLLEFSSFFKKVKEEIRWSLFIAWPAKCWSLGLSTCMKLWHYVLNFHWLHVWVEFPL